MARRVHAPVLVRPDRTIDDGLIALGGDARVLGRQGRAATEYEQEAKNRGREVARMEGHCRLSMKKCRRGQNNTPGWGEERFASKRIISGRGEPRLRPPGRDRGTGPLHRSSPVQRLLSPPSRRA